MNYKLGGEKRMTLINDDLSVFEYATKKAEELGLTFKTPDNSDFLGLLTGIPSISESVLRSICSSVFSIIDQKLKFSESGKTGMEPYECIEVASGTTYQVEVVYDIIDPYALSFDLTIKKQRPINPTRGSFVIYDDFTRTTRRCIHKDWITSMHTEEEEIHFMGIQASSAKAIQVRILESVKLNEKTHGVRFLYDEKKELNFWEKLYEIKKKIFEKEDEEFFQTVDRIYSFANIAYCSNKKYDKDCFCNEDHDINITVEFFEPSNCTPILDITVIKVFPLPESPTTFRETRCNIVNNYQSI